MTTTSGPTDNLPSNWGRWGADDERGTLHFITPEVRFRAVQEAKLGRCVSLARRVDPVIFSGGGPVARGSHAMPAPVRQVLAYTGSPARAMTDVLLINVHSASMTHIDAVAHIVVDGHVYPGIPLDSAVAEGTVRHGSTAAFAQGILTRGVLLDMAPGGRMEAGHEITGDDLDHAEERLHVRVESGDALVLRGGWNQFDSEPHQLPVLTVGALRWIAAREVSVFVGDIGDRPPGVKSPMALHGIGLARLGLPLIDAAALDELAHAAQELARYSFLLTAAPMPLHGATGLPINPIAIF